MSTWILLRGLTREKRHWGPFPQQFMNELPDAQVLPLELPGNGAFNHLASPLTIAGMATHCRAEAIKLGVPRPYHLLAMSMGAMVATAWAADHPEEIRASVLINTSFGSFSPLHHRMRPRAWPVVLRILLTPSEAGRERLIQGLTSGRDHPDGGLVEAWTSIRQSSPVSVGNALRQMVAASRFQAPLSASVPTLLLTSDGDGLVDPRCSREIARRWHCGLAVHPDAGHDLPLDDGAWVARKVREWLAESSLAD